MILTPKERMDCLCDYTYALSGHYRPESIIPSQMGTGYTFKDLVDELKRCGEVRIQGNAGNRLAFSMGVDLRHFGGTGLAEKAGKLYVEGDAGPEMGMGMVSGIIYLKGNAQEPLGNVVEVVSDEQGYRKFRSITDIICSGPGSDSPVANRYDGHKRHLVLSDGVLRGTIAARCNCEALVTVEGNAYNGAGLLMKKGAVHITGDAGMNAGAHLDGGTVIVDGTAGEFAGAYMKKGALILGDAKGFAGANLKGGVIYAKKKIKTAPPVEEVAMSPDDGKVIMKFLGTGHVEAMSYHKYGIVRERLVRMRDGSVVVRRD